MTLKKQRRRQRGIEEKKCVLGWPTAGPIGSRKSVLDGSNGRVRVNGRRPLKPSQKQKEEEGCWAAHGESKREG